MSRGTLDDSDWEQYGQELPDLEKLETLIYNLPPPDILSIYLAHNKSYQSWFPIAWACFKDAYEALWGSHYALYEVIAHDIWYLRKKDPPNEAAAALFGRFYAEDAAARLYSAGEHLANGIIMMLEISDEDLKPYKGKRISQQSVVGKYLCREKRENPVTEAVVKLAKSKEWQKTRQYRDDFVHNQPPTVKGLGIVYQRRIRWEPSPNGKGYILRGGGDKPAYSVDELIEFIKPAMFTFVDTFITVAEYYKAVAESYVQRWNDMASESNCKEKRGDGRNKL